jgi:hypothetical protein
MTIRHTIVAVAVSTVALLSGGAFAADFSSNLTEAKVAAQTAGRDVREAVIPALNAAQSLNAWGAQTQAHEQLIFARNKLGLATSSAVTADPVVATPIAVNQRIDTFEERLKEAKVASLLAGREIRAMVSAELSAAHGLNAQGSQVRAEDHLNFARSKLGLVVAAQAQSRDLADIYLPPSGR